MRYKAIIPFIPSMGSISPLHVSESPSESKEENLLWTLNKMREHDNLKPWTLDDLPEDIVFKPIIEN